LNILVLIPLLLMAVLMIRQQHMMVAGVAGAATAMIIGQVGFEQAGQIIMGTLPKMLGIVVPVMYSATALVVAKTGGFAALLGLSRKIIGDRQYLIAPVIVLIQALATYAAGLGAGNTMVTGPLALAVIGAIPQMVAAMAIATAASFMTSPSGADSSAISNITGFEIDTYAATMFPFTVTLWGIAMLLATYGVYRRGSIINEESNSDSPLKPMILKSIAPIYFLLVVVAGDFLNGLIGGYELFTPAFNMISTIVIAIVLAKHPMNEASEDLVQNSSFLLTKLFSIGIFLGFINILAEIGTFTYISGLISTVPSFIYLPAAIFTAFLIAIPAGAYSVGVTSLIFPILAQTDLTLMQMGLVAIAIGLGTQMSPVQINVAALSQTFNIDMKQVIKNNAPYVFGVMIILSVIGLFV
jgi:hypothetical protein